MIGNPNGWAEASPFKTSKTSIRQTLPRGSNFCGEGLNLWGEGLIYSMVV
jgi:hypothetical protein